MAKRQWGKGILVGLAALVIVVAAAGWWISRDEAPNQAHLAWAERIEAAESPTDAYLWLMGFTAPADDDPLAAGQRFLDDARAWLANSEDEWPTMTVGHSVSPDWQGNALPLPDTAVLRELLLCQELETPPCDQLTAVLDEHAVLLERFRNWPLTGEGLQSPPELTTLIPAFQGIVIASNLDQLDQLRLRLIDLPDESLARMAQHDRLLRDALAETRNLIGAMVMVAAIRDAADVRLRWFDQGWLPSLPTSNWLADIDNVDELLLNMMLGEFAFVRTMDQNMFDEAGSQLAGWSERLAFRTLFRPVATINHTAAVYQGMTTLDAPVALSELAAGERQLPQPPRHWDPLNLFPSERPFLDYVGRVHDLNAKLALARAWLALQPDSEAELATLAQANPYGEGYGIEWNEDGRLCFAGPFEDRQGVRCLPAQLTERFTDRET
ncbi:MAG: hypothetical protein ACXIUL_04590 [Wenzhouxiangella sp.]